ncbi:MAG: bifunctional UDP-N-acetylmuramoyl-tripeptide:D-alanyl-D-alanine ligase/alanine racemase [Chitinophagales bacterium]|nr:bifunctional UDP-N-acetylmuramoyl-tripeptide:D-alanyl-D-alanine ligase/alanine racemase [Chitinophagales bacterium]
MKYNTVSLKDILNAKWQQKGLLGQIHEILTDSRNLHDGAGTLFFAIPGLHHNGHDYIGILYDAGVRHFVVSQKIKNQHLFHDANFFEVDNTIKALQRIGRHHRKHFHIPIIGITGSNGKTIIKEWLFQLLHQDYHICRSPKSFNSQIGVPLSVWQLKKQHDLGIFEAGISQVDEMENLAFLMLPSIGIFANIGQAHSEGFASLQQKVNEKLKLFTKVERLIYCKDHEVIDKAVIEQRIPVYTWGKSRDANICIRTIEQEAFRTTITATTEGKEEKVVIPFTDEASIENAMHCWCLLKWKGYPSEKIIQRLAGLEQVSMRLEIRPGINQCILVNDSYNADLDGLEAALEFTNRQFPNQNKAAILSDILQSGRTNEQLYQIVAGLLKKYRFQKLVAIGSGIKQMVSILDVDIRWNHFDTTEDFLSQQQHNTFQSEVLLIKGARVFGFERIAQRLSHKVHQTQLEVNINALIHNIRVYQKYIKPTTRMMLMVKAAAYGSGSIEIARALAFHKIDYLAVAYADEGIELREGGIRLPILVLNPEEAVFDSILRYELEPEIYSIRLLRAFANFTGSLQKQVPIHLKLDTGMHRLGFAASDIDELISVLHGNTQLKVMSIFSHLAGSESAEHDAYTKHQYHQYQDMYERIALSLKYRPIQHILNSSGILRFPQYQMDMVRLGIGAYGVDGGGMIQNELQNVLRLSARISQIKDIEAANSVGYSRKGRVERATRIATLSIGYADGLPRKCGNGQFSVLIKGKKAPTIGNICMDMCMVDITNIPDAKEGDQAIIFGEEWPVQHLAEAIGTIPYEVFAQIAPRVRRVYVQE